MAMSTSLTLHFLLPSPTVLFFFFFLSLSFTFFLILKHKKPKSPPLPPGPTPWPLVGNLPDIFFNKPAFRWILALMEHMNTDIACIRLGQVHVIPVTCPDIAQEFLRTHDAIFASRPRTIGTEYSSRGFLNVTSSPLGEQWKKMRRVVASELMTRPRLNWLAPKRVEEADNLVRYLYERCRRDGCSGAVVDVRETARQCSGNVIRKMMFNRQYFGVGRDDGGPGFEEVEHVEALFSVVSLEYSFAVADYLTWLRWLDLDGHEKEMKKSIGVLKKYHEPLIDERIRKWRRGTHGRVQKEPEDLLDVMILLEDADGKPLLTSEEIKALAEDLILATVDNPPNAAEWAIAEMLNQPHILQRAVEELDRVVGKERLVQESDFSQLNYIKACAREAFRIHPIAPFNLPHMSTSDAIVAGYFIPKGSQVILSRTGLGRNPKVWHDPLLFKPERHLTSDESTQVELVEPDLRFISFSTGRRGCMGAQLGSAMTIMILARLLQGFTWTVPEGNPLPIDLKESTNDLFLAKPLHAHASPRLPSHVYPAP